MNGDVLPRFKRFVAETGIWIPCVVIILLMLPMVLTSRSFGLNYTLHLWMVRQQQWNIEATMRPALFVSANPMGAFYPVFAFVGSGVYSLGGYLAILLGDRPILAYKILNLLGLCLAFGGATWLSRQIGLRGWRSQMAGVTLVTGSYLLTDMYGRGDFAEFIALSAIPFLVAASCALLTSDHLKKRHFLAVAFGFFIFTGSHNITLLFGTIFIATTAVFIVAAYALSLRARVFTARAVSLLAAAGLGVGLNAWYLLPDLVWGSRTYIAKTDQNQFPLFVRNISRASVLLNPFSLVDAGGRVDPTFGGRRFTLPWLLFGWAVVVACFAWRSSDRATRILVLGAAFVTVSWFVLVVATAPWHVLPHTLYNVQFTWRLYAYVLLGTAMLVMFCTKLQSRMKGSPRRATSIALGAIAVFSVGAATQQVWSTPSLIQVQTVSPATKERLQVTNGSYLRNVISARVDKPTSWPEKRYFADYSPPVVKVDPKRSMVVPVTEIHGSKFVGSLDVPAGAEPFVTNIAASSSFVQMTGIRAVGRTSDGRTVAVRAAGTPPTGPVLVTIRPAESGLLRLGEFVSLFSILGILAVAVFPRRFLAERRATRPAEQ